MPMCVEQLIEHLRQFPPSAIVLIGNGLSDEGRIEYTPVRNVFIGCNEFDGIVFIDDYEESEDA